MTISIKQFITVLVFSTLLPITLSAQSWVDTLDIYARDDYMPPKKYKWTWQRAALLRSMSSQFEWASADEKAAYLEYIQACMQTVWGKARGNSPNQVASGFAMAFLARITGEEKYREKALKVYEDYLKIPRTSNGGVTHKKRFKELWDDTVFMIGIFLQEMYKLTGNEKYLDELILQVEAHREKLLVEEWGLWVHGWDDDDKKRCNFCGQSGWSKNELKRSEEIWGRGNGWVVVTLAQSVEMLEDGHPKKAVLAGYLKEMVERLPELQDTVSGHWFQLPVYPYEEGNYIESSATAMFAYGIDVALREGVVSGEAYKTSVDRAYTGMREYSLALRGDGSLKALNICKGTCIGDKQYYFNRKAKREKPSGLGMFILFGRSYQH